MQHEDASSGIIYCVLYMSCKSEFSADTERAQEDQKREIKGELKEERERERERGRERGGIERERGESKG